MTRKIVSTLSLLAILASAVFAVANETSDEGEASDAGALRRRVYVTSRDGAGGRGEKGVYVYDVDRNYELERFIEMPKLGGTRGACANAATDRMWISHGNDRLLCMDLRTDRVLWEETYAPEEGGADRIGVTPDGRKLYVPSGWWSADQHVKVVDASSGKLLRKIEVAPKGGLHNLIVSLDGRRVFIGSTRDDHLTVVDTTTDRIIRRVGPIIGVIQPLTVNGAQTRAYINSHLYREGHGPGFEVGDLETGKILHVVGRPDLSTRKTRCHGIGLTPDESEVWVVDQGHKELHVFNNTVEPPRFKTVVPMSAKTHGWICFRRDGKHAWCDTGQVFDVDTKKQVAQWTDEPKGSGQPVMSSKFFEIHFRGKDAVWVGRQMGVGYVGARDSSSKEKSAAVKKKGPVRVFVLSGQSNMEGKALASTLEPLLEDEATRARFQHLRRNGEWTRRDDVFVTFLDRGGRGGQKLPVHGPLSIGFGGVKMVRGADRKRRIAPSIGPELGIGHVLGDHFDEPVLLIKAAWGGRAVKHSFRPPSAMPDDTEIRERLEQIRRKRPDQTFEAVKASFGSDYRKVLSETRRVLEEIEKYVPGYDPALGYELSGVIWFQGWNDGVGRGNPDYVEQMSDFIRDLRRDLGKPGLPFVIGELGVDGNEAGGWIASFRSQQETIVSKEEFAGNVRLARTAHCWDTGPDWMKGKWEEFREAASANEKKSADDPTRVPPNEFFQRNWVEKYTKGLAYTSDKRYHYHGSGRSYYEMGESMGRAMVALSKSRQP